MGEESAGVNLIAENGDEEEDEDEGWWVGTVGVMEMQDWAGEIPRSVSSPEREQEGGRGEAGSVSQVEDRPGCPLGDCSVDEAVEDEWEDLGPAQSSLERGGAGAQHPRAPRHPSGGAAGSPQSTGAKRQRLKKRPGTTMDQD
jgi:hypothetical protein